MNESFFNFDQFYENYNKRNQNKFNIHGCENVDCIFKNVFKSDCENSKKFFISKDTLDFRLNVFQNLSNYSYKIEHNLNKNHLDSIYKFSRNKPFKIVECDKNIGSAIISNDFYDKLVLENLDNSRVYKEIFNNPLDNVVSEIKEKLSFLLLNKHINKTLFDKLNQFKKIKLGTFRLLPKLHKSTFSCRPIINCFKHPTSILSKLIDTILQPLVKQSFSYIKDSQEVLLKTKNLTIPDNSILYSCGFESLYTNIDTIN